MSSIMLLGKLGLILHFQENPHIFSFLVAVYTIFSISEDENILFITVCINMQHQLSNISMVLAPNALMAPVLNNISALVYE